MRVSKCQCEGCRVEVELVLQNWSSMEIKIGNSNLKELLISSLMRGAGGLSSAVEVMARRRFSSVEM